MVLPREDSAAGVTIRSLILGIYAVGGADCRTAMYPVEPSLVSLSFTGCALQTGARYAKSARASEGCRKSLEGGSVVDAKRPRA